VNQSADGQALLLAREREREAELQQPVRQAVLRDELGYALRQEVEQLSSTSRDILSSGRRTRTVQ